MTNSKYTPTAPQLSNFPEGWNANGFIERQLLRFYTEYKAGEAIRDTFTVYDVLSGNINLSLEQCRGILNGMSDYSEHGFSQDTLAIVLEDNGLEMERWGDSDMCAADVDLDDYINELRNIEKAFLADASYFTPEKQAEAIADLQSLMIERARMAKHAKAFVKRMEA